MIDTFKELLTGQFEASFCMLEKCVQSCPSNVWNARVGQLYFCQVAFHALFYADVYLGTDLASLRQQPFHVEHAVVFADYEELEDRPQTSRYEESFIRLYLEHCRSKAMSAVAAEDTKTLEQRPGFDWLPFSRAEVHVYNIRHLQHHVAQLSLRMKLDADVGVSWIGSGWQDRRS